MLLVGLTGGLGSGKSTVARMLSERGAIVVDADVVAREAIAPGTPGFRRVVETFGRGVLGPEGDIDRDALARVVFSDHGRRSELEAITHPEVFRHLSEVIEGHRDSDAVVVFDAPLIVETGFAQACDVIVVVTATIEDRVARVGRDRGMTGAEARARIEAQASSKEREAAADVVIPNDGDLAALERRVEALWRDLGARAREGE